MNTTKINSEKEYSHTLQRIELLMDAEAGTVEAAELKRLALMVEGYEEEHYPIDAP